MDHIKNYMEEIVGDSLDDIINDLDICKCERCKLDIMALALNNLPPKYIVTERGERYSKLSLLKQQFEVDVIAAITKAAMVVNNKKSHE